MVNFFDNEAHYVRNNSVFSGGQKWMWAKYRWTFLLEQEKVHFETGETGPHWEDQKII